MKLSLPFKHQLLITSLCLFSSSMALSQEYNEGETARANGNLVKAEKIWLPLAENGDVVAQLSLGLLYKDNVDQSKWKARPDRAFYWFKKCEEELPYCKSYLAKLYENGTGVKKDPQQAGQLFLQIAKSSLKDDDQFLNEARLKVGVAYLTGTMGEKNIAEAEKFIKLAANNQVPEAQMGMGDLLQSKYRNPHSASQLIEMNTWYLVAMKGSDPSVKISAEAASKKIQGKMTASQIDESRRLAAQWKPQPASPPQTADATTGSGAVADGK
jgi:hypothetical protein